MSNSELIELLMGDELKLIFGMDYSINSLALSVWQRTEPSESEAAHDEWNMLSKTHFRSNHPTKLMRQLRELTPMDEKAQ